MALYCIIYHNVTFVVSTELIQSEREWLENLEKKLNEGSKTSMDAEEISEELDVS